MTLEVYPIEIECIEEDGEPMFKMRSLDEYCANMEFRGIVGPHNVDEVCEAIRRAVSLLELKYEQSASV